MLNSCVVTGNLGADPDIFYSPSGLHMASFSLACRSSKDKTGWIKVVYRTRFSEHKFFLSRPGE